MKKPPLPARRQIILGCLYDSIARRIKTAEKKRAKYMQRIVQVLLREKATPQEIQRLHGNLNYASVVAPFGRPFLPALLDLIKHKRPTTMVNIRRSTRLSLHIWLKILESNRGISYNFVLNKLPRARNPIFVDASTEWGIGGCCGKWFFQYPWRELEFFGADVIPRKELLACIIAICCFSPIISDHIVDLFSDNTSVVT